MRAAWVRLGCGHTGRGPVPTGRIRGAIAATPVRLVFARELEADIPQFVNWPPVKGPVTATGVTGTFGTINRSDGSAQATFDGHPLYTFVGDTAPARQKATTST